jgi:methylenetetrahydrofolate reductase (NADPH)
MDKQLHNTGTPNGDAADGKLANGKPVTNGNGTKPLLENMVEAAKSAAATVTSGVSGLTISN